MIPAEKGWEQGLDENRGIYCRTTRARLGEPVLDRLEALPQPFNSMHLLCAVDEMVVVTRTGEELRTKVPRHPATKLGNGPCRIQSIGRKCPASKTQL